MVKIAARFTEKSWLTIFKSAYSFEEIKKPNIFYYFAFGKKKLGNCNQTSYIYVIHSIVILNDPK